MPIADRVVVIAGATGHLGGLIARAVRARGAAVRAIVRPTASPQRIDELAESVARR